MNRFDPRRVFAIAERALARLTGRTERELREVYAESLDGVRSELAKVFERYAEDGVLTQNTMSKYNRLSSLEKELNSLTGKATQRARSRINARQRDMFEQAASRSQWAIEMSARKRLPWGRIPKDAVRAAVESPLKDIGFDRLRTQSRERIRRSLAQAIANGDSLPKLSREIRKAINGNASDAMRIARTELHRTQNQAHLWATDRAEELGLTIVKEWVSVEDERTRASHEDMNGRTADDDGKFTMPDGAKGEAPGHIGEPHHDINCRCRYVDVVQDAPDDLDDIDEYEGYDSWAE